MTTSTMPVLPARRTRTARLVLDAPTRSDGGPLKLSGYAAVYNSPSEDLGFREVLEPGCFRRALETSDALLYWQHDVGSPLARQSAGSLRLREDERGLRFEAELAPTTLARDALTLVRAGVVRQMSFGFSYLPDGAGVRWEHRDGEPWCFVAAVGRLYEVSLVGEPAYVETSVEARAASRGRLKIRERDVYGSDSAHSWFWDVGTVTEAERAADAAARAGHRRYGPARDHDSVLPHRDWGGLTEARQRLATVAGRPHDEHRDVATAQLAGQASAVGVPEFILETLGLAVRGRARIAGALTKADLPPGFTVPGPFQAPRLTGGATVAVQAAEHDAVSETDPTGTGVDLKVATISGLVDLSRQLVERGATGDVWIARELGEALGERLDVQLVTGSGSAGQLLGLLNVSGIGSVAYADASPTQPESWPKVLEACSTVATGLGDVADLAVIHPRRWLWLEGWKDSAGVLSPPRWPVEAVLAATVPTTLGAGTNEDAIVVLRGSEAVLLTRAPVFQVQAEAGAGALTLRAIVWQYAALHIRQPAAVCKVTGTGRATPTFA